MKTVNNYLKQLNQTLLSKRIIHLLLFSGALLLLLNNCQKGPVRRTTLKVVKGANLHSIGQTLAKRQIISSLFWFKVVAKLKPNTNKIQTGVYEFNSRQSSDEIIQMMIDGKVKTFTFTLKEGMSNAQIKRYFANHRIMSPRNFELLTTDKKLLKKYQIPAPSTEGYLFPETYKFPVGAEPKIIIEKMLDTFFMHITKAHVKRFQKNKQLGSLHKAIILASIVEKESKAADERPKIASVFLNRLKINKKLESCATIQYILGKPKAKLLYKDLQVKHPYNTYKRKGLPPGPICNPGKAAILATLFPAKTEYLFFVRNPKSRDGRHYFSKTFKSHLDLKKRH